MTAIKRQKCMSCAQKTKKVKKECCIFNKNIVVYSITTTNVFQRETKRHVITILSRINSVNMRDGILRVVKKYKKEKVSDTLWNWRML